jgi:hydroquinone glucosyltransferase
VYPIGPVTTTTSSSDDDDATGCVEWLDAQPDRSVLFVSFGSGGALPAAQMDELARGLELSGHRFLWVVRSPSDGDGAANTNPGESYYDGSRSKDNPLSFLPSGFTERTKDVGRVVPSWAPQARVLAHRATAAMLTHCGWNSVLESVSSGVPMVAWPLYAEQRQNAVMLCEDTRVALRPEVRGEGGMVLAQDVAQVVREMMHGEKGEMARARVTELQAAAKAGLQPGGLAYQTLAQVVSIWKKDYH